MRFLRQTLALTSAGLSSIQQRRGSSLVTVVGVTTAVGVLVSLLAVGKGAEIFTGQNSANSRSTAVVLSRGTTNALQKRVPYLPWIGSALAWCAAMTSSSILAKSTIANRKSGSLGPLTARSI